MPKTLSAADIEAFRSRLCDVAEALFAAKGPEGVTIRELADALGVSAMTPYRYFEDKDAILAAVRTRAFLRFAEAMEQADVNSLSAAPSGTREAPTDQTAPTHAAKTAAKETPGNAYLDFALANPAAYRLMFDVNQPTASGHPGLVAAMDRARLTMGAGLRLLAAEGKFKGDVELAAHAFWAAMHGPIMLQLAGLLEPPMDARAIVRTTIEALGKAYSVPAG